jgi:hypothetical protein
MKRNLIIAAAMLGLATLGGCATVAPYEREFLAEKDMQVDPNPIDSAYDDHIYFSIEGSSGGRSFGGGGCGCN